jgi:chromosome segregation ATPase
LLLIQIKPAIEAVKDAKQNLSKAKDAYSAYKQDLVQQQAQLQALKAQLQADTGYIEQKPRWLLNKVKKANKAKNYLDVY